MKTVVMDDDPTGTQSAADVRVLLRWDAQSIGSALSNADSVYIQTNSRALSESDAVRLIDDIKAATTLAAGRLGEQVRFVLRGDSTLRGHVFAEIDAIAGPSTVVVFAPAFPDGGRTTEAGVHYLTTADGKIPVDRTEYAADPVFSFSTAVLTDYVASKSGRAARSIPIDVVRGSMESFVITLATLPPGTVAIPDAVTNDDIARIANAIETASAAGTDILVRSAAPLAAQLAGVGSTGLLPTPLLATRPKVLVVCGSHTTGATAQLAHLKARHGAAVTLPTQAAFDDPNAAARHAAAEVLDLLETQPLVMLTTERVRRSTHNTLEHGEKVMAALVGAARLVAPGVDVVVAKGGITSAQIARDALGATSAHVSGQVLAGVSVWSLASETSAHGTLYVVVPGNVGGEDTLTKVAAALNL